MTRSCRPAGILSSSFSTREHQVGQRPAWDRHPVERHQRPEARGDDRAGTRHADLRRNVAAYDGEISSVEVDAALPAIVVEALDRGLEQAQPTVVAELPDILGERRDPLKGRVVALGRQDLQIWRLVEHHLRFEILHDERDRLAVVAVGRIADQPGSWKRCGADYHGSCTIREAPFGQGECQISFPYTTSKARRKGLHKSLCRTKFMSAWNYD